MSDEIEFLVHFQRTLCISVPPEDATVACLKQRVQQRERVPADALDLYVNGRKLADNACVPRTPTVVRARMRGGLLGGKGGFGAMLRSMGKGSGAKATTDYGACRDLNGRRLRHVNQEIAMHKWKEESELREQRKKLGISEQEIMDEDTPSGIPGWYLATPSWAEGVKKSYMKRRRNTMLCKNWLKAREDGRQPPPNAPRWWGCPRGRDCDFAHGEEELRGSGLTELKKQKKDQAQQQKHQALQQYVDYEQDMPTDDIADAIRQGMQKRKARASAKAVEDDAPEGNPAAADPAAAAAETSAVVSKGWMVPVSESVGTAFNHGLCELRGQTNFGTATVTGMAVTSGKWYYEVKLITNGVMQIGWADGTFEANSENGDGVGDHARSWAYDGCRQLKWTQGTEQAYAEKSGWEQGDIIGCQLDLDAGTMAFSRNGKALGVAFKGIKVTSDGTAQKKGFFPAISVESTEILLVNIGAQSLLHRPNGYQSVYDALQGHTGEDTKTETKAQPVKSESKPAPQANEAPKDDVKAAPVEIDLSSFKSAKELEKLGLEELKAQLLLRHLKCGGTLEARAERLFSVQGKRWDEIDPKIKNFKALRS
ncbi:TPA: hypothetical protein N0F65_003776 [Lagenidium giganteum]|uniref:Uncharacterized protein n=1 Tax=Lagenidium giganteum TaxID=4803 RepID=A0AAV2YG60_9STRA|nr:TPA: hypothetical protein N0F65_003776 [Lagenidium giganteum]